jgi:hypothetical protein
MALICWFNVGGNVRIQKEDGSAEEVSCRTSRLLFLWWHRPSYDNRSCAAASVLSERICTGGIRVPSLQAM